MSRKTVLITGASGAVGSALLELARAAEWDAIGVYHHNDARAAELERAWAGAAGTLRLQRADLSMEAEAEPLLQQWSRELTPDAIVHLAAPPIEARAVQRTDWDAHQRQLDVVLKPMVLLTRTMLEGMLRRGSGRIVGVLSAVVLGTPPRGFSSYTTAKYALAGYLRCLAAECAGRGVTANAVSPGPMNTGYLRNLPALLTDTMRDAVPGKSWIDPATVARAIFWLLEDAGPELTGCNLPITAGLSF